jgi:hypothetical protein
MNTVEKIQHWRTLRSLDGVVARSQPEEMSRPISTLVGSS